MKRVSEGIEFTAVEQFVMMLGGSHQGLREISKRRGVFSREEMPQLDRSVVCSATKVLNILGDWKVTGEEITKMCEWSREENFRKKGFDQTESQNG